jgi:hypothetical protein
MRGWLRVWAVRASRVENSCIVKDIVMGGEQ